MASIPPHLKTDIKDMAMTGFLHTLDSDQGRLPMWPGNDAPSMARFYDAMLCGKDNYAADRALAHKVATLAPAMPWLFQQNRVFVAQAVRHMAGQGVDQFLDLGCGLPTAHNSGRVAQRQNPSARMVYVDHDPVVVSHTSALLADNARTAIVSADIRDPCAVFGTDEAQYQLDLSRPVGILLTSVLHHMADEDDPRGLVRSYLDRVPSGSLLALSHFHAPGAGEPLEAEARDVEEALLTGLGSGWFRSASAIARLFDGLVLDEQGLCPVSRWRAGRCTADDTPRTDSLMLCGVVRKP